MSLGASTAMEKMLAPAKVSLPLQAKFPVAPSTSQCRTPSASAKKGSLRSPMNSRHGPAWTGAAVASKPTGVFWMSVSPPGSRVWASLPVA
jgi:hypothetical protein